ncbi:MAG: flavodoxin family protein [Eubacteriaceae bacterium]|jgi:multimeric flavodoxin WrbA|nr:flavodoxin family protein [Eubacteriaceae bacterium]
MKVLMINGSPHEHGCTYTALHEVEKKLAEHGIASEIFWIGSKPVPQCIACRKCSETGRCIFDDSVNSIHERIGEFDAMVVGSPVYYASASAQVCAFLDRLFFSGGNDLAGMFGASVVSCRRGGASAAFDRLNKYFLIASMNVVSSQYWNQVHGNTPEEVMQDLEGLQTMRTLGENLAYLLKCREAGKANGVPEPEYEKGIATNFVR